MKKKIISWIRKQVKQAKAKGIVMGLSGGIDSSVVATLAKEAVGERRCLALILPCLSQIQELKDARLMAGKLGINTKTVDLSKTYDNLIRILPKAGRLAKGNLKPRLRMLTLYYFANKLNYLVCGTGNKSEIMVGYFTKFGDGAADILPIGDLSKKQVRELAKELGIPGYIINKTPSAGLWPGQSDEAELGISYYQLDDILLRLSGKQRQVQPRGLVNKVKFRIRTSEHKLRLPLICKI